MGQLPRFSGAQHLAHGRAGELSVRPGHHAVDHGVLDAARRHDHALGAAGQIEPPLAAVGRAHAGRVEDGDVGRQAGGEPAAAPDAEDLGRVRGEPPHPFLQRQRLALAHPGAERVGRVARIAQHIDVGAAVPQRHQHALVVQDLRHAVDPRVERGHGELDVEVVLEGQVPEGIEPSLPCSRAMSAIERPSSALRAGELTSDTRSGRIGAR